MEAAGVQASLTRLVQLAEASLALQQEQVNLQRCNLRYASDEHFPHTVRRASTRLTAAFVNLNKSSASDLGIWREATERTRPSGISPAPQGKVTPRQSWISQAPEEAHAKTYLWDLDLPSPSDSAGGGSPKYADIVEESMSLRKGFNLVGNTFTAVNQFATLNRGMTLDKEAFGPTINAEASLLMQRPPRGMSEWIVNMMFLCAIWPASCASRSRQWLYMAYRAAVVATMIGCVACSGYMVGLHVLHRDARCTLYILVVVGGLIFLAKWAALSWAFGPDGVAMGLLHDVVHRGEDLKDFHNSLKIHLFLGAVSIVAIFCSRIPYDVGFDFDCEVSRAGSSAGSGLSELKYDVGCVTAQVAYYPLASALVMLVWSVLWLIHTLCTLHVKELRWFAETVAETLLDDDGSQDILGDLNIVEGNITRRFIRASQGWVFVVVAGVSVVAVVWTLSVTMIISGNHNDKDLISLIISLVLCTLLMGYSFLPLAKVAEVYEYDLLRTLNKPKVLHKAMPLLGQQMLPHLHTLEWGFKIGQTIINMRLVVNILGAIALTSVTTAGAAMMSSMSG